MLHPELPFIKLDIVADNGYLVGSFNCIVPINSGRIRFYYNDNGVKEELIKASDREYLKGEVLKYSKMLIDSLKQ